jgi:hypothetical protein
MWSLVQFFILPTVLLAAQPAGRLPDNIVDMSHPLVPGDVMPNFPGHEKYEFKIKVRGEYPGTKM